VPSRALAEDLLQRILAGARPRSGAGEPQRIAHLLTETLELAARLVPAACGVIALEEPRARGARGTRVLRIVAAFGERGDARVGELLGDDAVNAGERDARRRRQITEEVRLEDVSCGVLVVRARHGATLDARDAELVALLARYLSRTVSNAVAVLAQHELARRDELTGVRNVRGLQGELEDAVERAVREHTDVAVFFVDVDHLKRVNDLLGHAAGSETLKRVGRALARAVGAEGEAYRFGGDEFVVVAPALDVAQARALGGELRRAVREASPGALRHVGVLPGVTISVGVATLRASLRPRGDERRRASRLLVAADRALYRAKHAGRDAVSVATVRDDAPRPGRARR
jgi:diguanylate cyclase (GGDEF)-like protein